MQSEKSNLISNMGNKFIKADSAANADLKFNISMMFLFETYPGIKAMYTKAYKDLSYFMRWNGGYDIKKIKKEIQSLENKDRKCHEIIESLILKIPYKGEIIPALRLDILHHGIYDIHQIRIRSLWIPIYFKELEKKYGKLL